MDSDTSNNIKTTVKQSLLRSTTKVEKFVNEQIQKNNVSREEHNENVHNQQNAHQVIPNKMAVIEGRAPRNRDRCLFCCTPKVLMIISSIYFILGVISSIFHAVTYLECRNLYARLDSTTPSILSYDPSTISTLNVKGFQYYRFDEILISQTNDVTVTNATIQVRMSTDGDKIMTSITPSAYNLNLGDESWWASWTGKCVVSRVEVTLPQQQTPVNINSYGLDVKFKQNFVSYYRPITLKTTSSNIDIEDILATYMSIQTSSGNIRGSISSLQNELNIETTSGNVKVEVNTNTESPRVGIKSTSGDIDLKLGVPKVVVRPVVYASATSGDISMDINLVSGITDSQITVKATSGDVDLKLHNSFEGQYQIQATSGDVRIGRDGRQGRIGSADSQGFLNVVTTSGNVDVGFN